MDWLYLLVAGMVLVLVLAPVVLLLGTLFVLVPLAHLAPAPPTVARASFDCPFSERRVSVAFLTTPGADRPSDVVSCSLFDDGVRCHKGCLELTQAAWRPSALCARYALLADGEAHREAA